MKNDVLKVIFLACVLTITALVLHINLDLVQNSKVELAFEVDITKYLHEVCRKGNQTVLILIQNIVVPANNSNTAGFQILLLNEFTDLSLPLIISFLRNHDCIEKIIVLNSGSVILNNYELLRDMANSRNIRDNVILNNMRKGVKLSHILQCFYMYDQNGHCEKISPFSTCEHNPAIIQYLYHSNQKVANGQPSLTIVFEQFNLDSVLNSDFVIMKSGLANSSFVVSYHSPVYNANSTLTFTNAFHHSIVAGESNMHTLCKTPSYRSRTLEEVFYAPPKHKNFERMNGLDEQSTQCKLQRKFSEINTRFNSSSRFLLIAEFRYKQYYKRLKDIFEILYRPVFKHILYCGPNTLNNSLFENVSHISATENRGFTSYECLVKAIRIGYKVDGYVLLSDDAVLQCWNFLKLNISGLYMQKGQRRIQFKNQDPWVHWNTHYGVRALNNSIIFLKKQQDAEIRNFLLQYEENMQETAVMAYADFVYLPNKYSSTYRKVGEVLAKYGVFLEIATAFIFHGLESYEKIEHNEGNRFFQTFSANGIKQSDALKLTYDNVVFHPIKFSKVNDSNSIYSSIFCKFLNHLQTFLVNNTIN